MTCISRTLALALMLGVLIGCAGQRSGPGEPRLFVVGLTSQQPLREAFEDATVSALQRRGIAAVASHPQVPEISARARESILQAAHSAGATAIVAVRALGLSADGALVDEVSRTLADNISQAIRQRRRNRPGARDPGNPPGSG